MASLINRIQRAFLGSAGEAKVRALLAELAIPAGGSGGTMREARRGFLRPISDEAILRDALANFGLSGGGGGGRAQALSRIRTAVLHNLHDSETTLRDGLNDLLLPDDLGSGGGTPEWVPADAKLHIDLVGNRAWTETDGEVAVDTLLGSDPNTVNGWDATEYDPANLTEFGYQGAGQFAFIGGALATILSGVTLVYRWVRTTDLLGGVDCAPLIIVSANGDHGIEFDAGNNPPQTFGINTYDGPANVLGEGELNIGVVGAVNVMAATFVSDRADMAYNGAAAVTTALTPLEVTDYIAALCWIGPSTANAVQSITIYNPLPNTTGLSALSEVA